MSVSPDSDVVDHLAGVEPGSSFHQIRARRAQARENAQKSYLALFQPSDFGTFPARERWAVAAFAAGLHREPIATELYASKLRSSEPELGGIIDCEAGRGVTVGPFGHYPAGPLSGEDKPGLIYRVEDGHRSLLGERLSAGLEHTHLLVFHPRDAGQEDLNALHQAGWSSTDIVTLSQLVAFLTFQIRVGAGLRALAASR
ncbi:MAG: CMD domain protein [Bradyrhizobium sp.]|nr:CMD domain protein [Bradyrhizobium sp.]